MTNKLSFLLPGIKVTLEEMPDNGVIVALTEARTVKQKKLENEIWKLSKEKNIKIFFVFATHCSTFSPDTCQTSYRLSNGRNVGLWLDPNQASLAESDLVVPKKWNPKKWNSKKLVEDFIKNVVFMVTSSPWSHPPLS